MKLIQEFLEGISSNKYSNTKMCRRNGSFDNDLSEIGMEFVASKCALSPTKTREIL
jgi:hypothetical protein